MGNVYLTIEARINLLQTELIKVQTQMAQLQQKSEEVNQTMRNEFGKSGKVAESLKGILGGLFSVGAITAFISKMINMRVEFEKQTQVLKTLTGSQKEAEATMRLLKRVADDSILPLKEITDAYIRLYNKGIKPTTAELKKMIDVAASTGKSFGQLAEAIFDAANKQTRGLRDFGIQSKEIGNKIQLSFKGITETVDYTAESISDFIIKMGDAQGVMGAGQLQTGTLAKAVDDLGDSWESLLKEMGEKTSGVFFTVFTGLQKILDAIRDITTWTPGGEALVALDRFKESLVDLDKEAKAAAIVRYIEALRTEMEKYGESLTEVNSKIKSPWIQNVQERDALLKQRQFYEDMRATYRELIPMLNEYLDQVNLESDVYKEVVKQVELLNEQLNKLKLLKEDLLSASTIEQQEKIKDQIVETEAAIKKMMETDVDRAKTKKELDEKEEKRQEKRTNELEKELNRQEGIYNKFYSWLESEVRDTWDDIKEIEESHWRTANYIIEKMYLEREITEKEYLENKRQIEIEQAKIVGKDEIKTQEEINAEIDLINAEFDQKQKDRKVGIAKEILSRSIEFLDIYSQYQNARMNQELVMAEGNEKKQEEIRRKYARKEQTLSIARAIISGAEGILKTGANLGYPFAIPFQLLQGIQTALLIATIKAQKFATGILDLKGRGTGTSDSIPAMLSRGESVMTARETDEYYPYLKAMKEGKFPKLQMELMNDFAKLQGVTNNNLNYDNSKEIRELRAIRKALDKNYSETIEGKYKVVRRGNITTKISLN